MKDFLVREDDSLGAINKYCTAKVCFKGWGLHYGALAILTKTERLPLQYSFPAEVERLEMNRLQSIIDAVESTPKVLGWKLRALLGERIPFGNNCGI